MTGEELYGVWAPPEAAWSAWAKPVLFAEGPTAAGPPAAGPPAADGPPGRDLAPATDRVPPADGETALVLDLAADLAVELGARLARDRGYRPVPLFNGCVGPGQPMVDSGAAARLLVRLAPVVSEANAALAPGAPPAFLLDHFRMARGQQPRPGQFDNRWLAFPPDFPSGPLLLARGVKVVVVVTAEPEPPAEDLVHVLLRWRRSGLRLLGLALSRPEPAPLDPATPWTFRRVWYRALATLGLRRSSVGGFGALLPTESLGGGHGYTGYRGGFG
ncbi:MAG: hypothetical protein HY722_16140 [Planctomycetes bacterium]|nr:hypothetical protein [Planctomycetota bacterium]